MKIRFWKYLIFILLLAFIASSCGPKLPSKRILFIGNSYTDLNGGLDTHLLGFAPNSESMRITPGGYTLKDHWQDANTLDAIRSGKWDVVVLQEQSQNSVTNYYNFFEYAQKLDAEIKKAGAETIMFMTWERPDSTQYGVTAEAVNKAYTALGQQLGVKVAPVELAFSMALQERPDLKLYIDDGHPTPEGTYLTACVFYGFIFQQSPVGNSYGGDVSKEDKDFLQAIAAKALGQ